MKISKKSVLTTGFILTTASIGLMFVSAAWDFLNEDPDVELKSNPSNAIQHFQNVKIIATGNTDDANATISKNGSGTIRISTDYNFALSLVNPSDIDLCDFNGDGIITDSEVMSIAMCIVNSCTNHPEYDVAGGGNGIPDGIINVTDTMYCSNRRLNQKKPFNKITKGVRGSSILGGFGNKIKKGIYETILGGNTNTINSGDSNSILGGQENTIENAENSVIFGGVTNVISGVYGRYSAIVGGTKNTITISDSTIVGKNNTVDGQNSIAMGSKAKVSGKNSFLWSDNKVKELSGDNIFAVIGNNGMVVNSTEAHDLAQLSISGSLIVYDDGNTLECTGATKGVLKVITGDNYNSEQECFCSCDGSGRNALHEGTRCTTLCANGTGLQAECGGIKVNCANNPYLYTGDDTSGACAKGELVGGTGAFFVTTNKNGNTFTDYINWSCQSVDGHITQCIQELNETCPNIQTGYECTGSYENVTGHIIINEEPPTNSATFWTYDPDLSGPCTYKCDEYGEWDPIERKCTFHVCSGELSEGSQLNNEIALPMNDTTEYFYDETSTGACAYSCLTGYGYFYSGAINKCITCPAGQVYDETDGTCKVACDTNNTDFETITIMDASGYAITIADRNLGASSSGTGDLSSYGCYFQWGNNYGFQPIGLLQTGTDFVNTSSYGPGNPYSSEIFRVRTGEICTGYGCGTPVYGPNDDDWSYPANNNLRGGAGDSSDNAFGVLDTNKQNRQGPCPDGYHVPSIGERNDLLIMRYNNQYKADGVENLPYIKDSNKIATFRGVGSAGLGGAESKKLVTEFRDYFMLPPASSRDFFDFAPGVTYGNGGSFWTSSSPWIYGSFATGSLPNTDNRSSSHPNAANSFDYNISSEGYVGNGASGRKMFAQSVRCFKDVPECPAGKTRNPSLLKCEGDSDCDMDSTVVQDLELFFIGSSGDISHYMMMDRNMGAFEVYNQQGESAQNAKSYGCHFQWGNNYGFSLGATTTRYGINPSAYGPGNYYSSNKFFCKNKNGSQDDGELGDEDIPDDQEDIVYGELYSPYNYHMWGGGYILYNRTFRTGYGSNGSDVDRQGPCPDGYHVPGGIEMDDFLDNWNDASLSHGSLWEQFASDLLMPFGRYIELWCGQQNRLKVGGGIWLSDVIYKNYGGAGGGHYMNHIDKFSSTGKVGFSRHGRAHGFPIRCVKNGMSTSPQKVTIHPVGGTGAVIAIDWQNNGSGKITTLGEPTKNGIKFQGWYSDEGFTNPVNTGDYISNGGHLYAKWNECKPAETQVKDLEIFLLSSGGNITHYTLMDRNLGAKEVFNQSFSSPNEPSYGCYFQWGNNYGFPKDDGTLSYTSETLTDPENYGPGKPNGYYSNSSKFCYNGSGTTMYPPYYDSLLKNWRLWGGGITNGEHQYTAGSDGTDTERQGPCPDGYHIPRGNEMENILNEWKDSASSSGYGARESTKFAGNLLLPYAGYNEVYCPGGYTYFGGGSLGKYAVSDHWAWANHLHIGANTALGNGVYLNGVNAAHGFSIRCAKNNISANQKITINANGGTGAVITIDWETDGTGKIVTLTDPQKRGIEFLGWYTDEGFSNRVEVGDYINNGGNLYARWSECDVANTIVSDLELFFLSNTGYISHYTMMDRNLGAGEIYNQDSSLQNRESFGCFFQWGNNHGFSTEIGRTRSTTVDVSSYGPDHYYSNSILFCNDGADRMYTGSFENLRGGITNTDLSKKGPCPEGYHVPNLNETAMLISGWQSASSGGGIEFASDILSPFAGAISPICGEGYKINNIGGNFWSTDVKNNLNKTPYHISILKSGTISIPANGVATGFPVRCVKNNLTTTPQKITIHPNGGTEAVIAIDWETDGTGKFTSLGTPSKNGTEFLGWYTDEGFTNRVNLGNFISSGSHLYAKWNECNIIDTQVKDLEVFFILSTGDISHYTLMDRNLGATETYNQTYSSPNEPSYGCYFQWGNNYPFNSGRNGSSYTQETFTDTVNYGHGSDRPNGYYSNPRHYCLSGGRDNMYPIGERSSGTPFATWLWGGGWITNGITYLQNERGSWGVDGSDIDRQGPCPEGYHIPRGVEMNNIVEEWKDISNYPTETGLSNIRLQKSIEFASNLLLPFAGFNGLDCNHQYLGGGTIGGYAISDYYNYNKNHLHIGVSSAGDGMYLYSNGPAYGESIRCVKNDISANQKVTIHANGGTSAVISIDWENSGSGKIVALGEPIKPGYKFLGWYSDSGFNNQINTGSTVADSGHLYAKWEKVQDLDIYILGETGNISHYMMMDRNLGAIYIGHNGSLYQWGNNYGFHSFGISTSATQVDASEYGPGNYYSSSVFIRRNSNDESRGRDSSDNKNLWGGESENVTDKQGPCPSGYHVPSHTERVDLYNDWDKANIESERIGEKWASDFLLPSAGYLDIEGGFRPNSSYYRSSTRFTSGVAYYAGNHPTSGPRVTAGYYTSMAFSVRCFKDTIDPEIVTIHANGGTGTVITIDRETEGSGKIMTLGEPSKDGIEFLGWYSDEGFTNSVNTGDYISTGGHLYAKWNEGCSIESTVVQNLEVFLLSSTGNITQYTMMDRNLGATEAFNQEASSPNEESYGCYFQWGNNYGFPNKGDVTTGSNQVNASEYGPYNYYSSPTFITENPRDLSNNKNLWGWETNTPEAKQGPCPTGYHVPSEDEWYDVYDNWNSASVVTDNKGIQWASDLLIPFAGYRYGPSANVAAHGTLGDYWSSEASSAYTTLAYHIFFNPSSPASPTNTYIRTAGLSIRCFKNTTNPQTLTIHPNGGTRAVISIDWESDGSGKIVALGTPSKDGIEFLGWYTDEGFTNPVNTGDYISNSGHLYAKWNETVVQDLDIYILGTTGDISRYVLMDRNLGATEVFNQNFSSPNQPSYGYYYQWGNNYGFPNQGNITTSSEQVDASGYGPGNYYSSAVFIIGSQWDTSNNENLWGEVTNTFDARQGPCPSGYHVPSNTEWKGIYDDWNDANIVTSDIGRQWASDFLMPFVGYRSLSSSSVYSKGSFGRYWSSKAKSVSAAYSFTFDSLTLSPYNNGGIANGYSVRCFKNTIDTEPINIHADGGKKAVISIDWESDGSGKIVALGEPSKEGYDFGGWYSDEMFSSGSLVSLGDYVSNGSDLYVRWIAKNCDVVGTRIQDLELYLLSSTGNVSHYTMMDRNLGASEVFNQNISGQNEESFGCYFQWGNNYGFHKARSGDDYFTGTITNSNEYGPSRSLGYFIKASRHCQYPPEYSGGLYQVTQSLVPKASWMWGGGAIGENGYLSGGWGEDGSDEYRRGPCPEGYHIPRAVEMDNIVKEWKDISNYSEEECANSENYALEKSQKFAIDLLLPMAGQNDIYCPGGTGVQYNGGPLGAYFISDYYKNRNHFLRFGKSSDSYWGIIFEWNSPSHGHSIRCVKNDISANQKITLYPDGGTGAVIAIDWESEGSGKIMTLGEPSKSGYKFSGWYTDELFTNPVSTGDYISSGDKLYANWVELVAIFMKGSDFNSTVGGYWLGNGKNNIKSIKRTDSLLTGKRTTIISDAESPIPIVAQYKDGTVYYYTEAEKIYLNEDSSIMFKNYKNLVDTDITKLDTSKVTNMNNMFAYCSSLTGLNLSNWDVSNVTDMKDMFYYCNDLINLNLSGWNANKVTDMSTMFYYCTSLTNLNVSNWNTSNVKNMNGMFSNCRSLTGLDIGNWNTSNVTNMSSMFSSCNSLKSLNLSGWDTSNVTGMGGMFFSVQTLTGLDLSSWDVSNVEDMEGMFYYCYSLEKLDIDNWNTSRVTTMEDMFNHCEKLTNLNISKWNVSNVTSMYQMFHDCKKITYLDLSGWNISNVRNINSMFRGCSNLTGLDVSNWDTSNVTSLGRFCQGCSKLKNLDVSRWNTSNVRNLSLAFHGCSSLQALDVSHWDTSNVTDMRSTFDYCYALTGLDVSNWNTSNVTRMNEMFAYDSKLKSLDVSGWDTSNVTEMRGMFDGCLNLTGLNVSNRDTSSVTDMTHMFRKCKNLTGLDISNWNTSKVTSMQGMFDGCSNLTGLNVSNWNTSMNKSLKETFQGCTKIKSLDLNNWNTSSVTNMENMLSGCNNLEKIYVGPKFRTSNVTSSNGMFFNNTNLVGGRGTPYNSNYTDKTYARIDTESQSGYFTRTGSTNTTIAYLVAGPVFNRAIKSIAKGDTVSSYKTEDTLITKIEKSNNLPSNLPQSGEGVAIISTTDSEMPVYAWYDNGIIYYYTRADIIEANADLSYMFYNLKSLTEFDLKIWDTSNVTNLTNMFGGCSNLIKLDLDNLDMSNWDVDNSATMESIFEGCNNLINLNLSGWNLASLIDEQGYLNSDGLMDYLFGETPSRLTRLNISNVKMPQYMEYSFHDLTNLQKLESDGIDTSEVTNMRYVFEGCSNLKSIDLNHWDVSNVHDMAEMFSNCDSLTYLNLSEWDVSNVTDMEGMFSFMDSLTGLDLSNRNTNKLRSTYEMFQNCSNLQRIYTSTGFTTDSVTYSYYMFHGCTNIVGGNGTTYDSNYRDKTYARIDKSGIPGYFTQKS